MSNLRTRIEKIERQLEPEQPDFAIVPICRTKAEHVSASAKVREKYPKSCLIDYQPVFCR